MQKVAVIGAGIVGASVAYRLAKSGEARVLVFDDDTRRRTTSTSFAWVNANQKTPRDYFELNRAGLEEHYRLRDGLPGGTPWLNSSGNIEWAEDEEALEGLNRRVERLRSWGYAAEWWTASRVNETLEPNVAFPSPEIPVAFFPEEAWVDAPWLAEAFVELACQSGAEARPGAAVEGIETGEDGRVSAVRVRGGERLPVEAVVNAAGPGADLVAAMLGRALPLKPSKGLLARLAARETPISRLVHSPRINLRPDGRGCVLIHHGSIDEKLQERDVLPDLPSELLERAQRAVPALEGANGEGSRIGVRSMPEDGLPCVGAVPGYPGYYEAVTHSGVTLGPLIGRLLAREMLTGEVDPLIAPFRPDRFARD
jgi:glycine/D-amino acid oxidase-like deaminating enzyme